MEFLTSLEVKQGRGFASDSLRSEVENLKENELIINFAYTDYGGTFFDKVFIEYFEKYYNTAIVIEDTSWNGKNAFLFGTIAEEFRAEYESYPLGFRDIEEYYFQREYEEEIKGFKLFLKDLRTYENYRIKRTALNFLCDNRAGYYNITTQGIDFSSEELEQYLLENNQIIKK